jgi:hypothetical protein
MVMDFMLIKYLKKMATSLYGKEGGKEGGKKGGGLVQKMDNSLAESQKCVEMLELVMEEGRKENKALTEKVTIFGVQYCTHTRCAIPMKAAFEVKKAQEMMVSRGELDAALVSGRKK